MKDLLKNKTEELLNLLGVSGQVDVVEGEGLIEVNIESQEDAGLLIGFRGENIYSFETILSMILKNETGEWHRVAVNIGDYREKQENKLKDLAEQTANRAIETDQPQPIYNLNSSQRRIIHMYLSERKDVITESEGVEPERYLVVKPK